MGTETSKHLLTSFYFYNNLLCGGMIQAVSCRLSSRWGKATVRTCL